jgi:hypothetical protein
MSRCLPGVSACRFVEPVDRVCTRHLGTAHRALQLDGAISQVGEPGIFRFGGCEDSEPPAERARSNHAAGSSAQGRYHTIPLPGPDGRESTLALLAGPIGNALPLAVRSNRLQAGVSASEHHEVDPVGCGIERAQPQQLCHRELGLDIGVRSCQETI